MKKNLWIMYAIALLQGMVFYGPIATLYRQAHGITIFQITLIESISLALLILLEIPWGIIADKIGCRHTIIVCSVLYLISKIIFWKSDGFAGFLLERIMLSVVESGFSGVDSTILYLSCGQKNSQKVFGIYHSMSMAGLLFAAGVYALFVQDQYPLAGFLTVISYGVAAFLSLFLTDVRIHSVKKTDAEPFRATIKKAMKNRSLLLFLIAAALLSETHQTITVFLNQLQYQKCGLSGSSIGLLFVAATLLGLFGILFLLCHRTAGNLQLPSAFLQHGSRFLPYPGSDPSGVPVCGGHPDPQIQQYFVPASPDRNPEPADPDRQPRHCS